MNLYITIEKFKIISITECSFWSIKLDLNHNFLAFTVLYQTTNHHFKSFHSSISNREGQGKQKSL